MKKQTVKHKTTELVCHENDIELMVFLISKMGGMRRNSVKQLLAHRQVQVNGKVETQYNCILHAGDKIGITSGAPKHELVHPRLKVVYEDDYLIVVEKGVGLLTVPTFAESKEISVFSLLKHYVRQDNPRAGIYVVHRLDRETSGLLVFAKTAELQEYMRTYWRQLVTRRTYIALAEGILTPAEGKITTWLTEDKRTTRVYSSDTDDGGKVAITNYRVIRQTDGSNSQPQYSLVELNLETGRTNQIRVHLSSKGHPVVGDRKYGNGATTSIDRLALHARILEFVHPVTEQTVHFETPVPRAFLHVFHGMNKEI